jgi:apolipoprotein N-acyltransferase
MALTPLIIALWQHAVAVRTLWSRRAFLLGLTTGLAYFAGTVYWTGSVMAQYGGLNLPVAASIAGLLVAYLALFPALFGVATHALMARYGASGFVLVPLAWTASEYGRLTLFGGFPWVLLGYSQVPWLAVAQVASLVGVFGVSTVVAAVSTALAWAVVARDQRGFLALAAAVVVVLLIVLWGSSRLSKDSLIAAGRPLRVGIVQGNVPQDQKWDPAQAREIFDRYVRLTVRTIGRGAQLILWPESATPFYFGVSGTETAELRELARRNHVAILIGSDQWEAGSPPKIYNAAFLLQPDGSTGGVYRKVHLVPFGEYVPLKRILFFAAPLVEAVSDFSAGARVNTLPIGDSRISTAICYEVVYPALIRDGVLEGSALLTTITNDAWFGRSSAPWQHFQMATMRAIEQGRYLVRSANTGISGVVDPYGRVLAASALFVEGQWTMDVRLIDDRTLYSRIGDVVAWASVLVTMVALIVAARPVNIKGRPS